MKRIVVVNHCIGRCEVPRREAILEERLRTGHRSAIIRSPQGGISFGETLPAPGHHPRNVVQVDALVKVLGPRAHPGRFHDDVVRQLALDTNGELIVRSGTPIVIEKGNVGACGGINPRLRRDRQSLLHSREGPGVAIHTHAEAVGRIGTGPTVTVGNRQASPWVRLDTSTITPDSLAEAVPQKGHKHEVNAVVPLEDAGVAGPKHSLPLAKDAPQDSGLEPGVPGHGSAGAEAAIEGLEGILGMTADCADGLEPEDGIIDLSLQRVVYRVLEVSLAGKDGATRANHKALHAVDV